MANGTKDGGYNARVKDWLVSFKGFFLKIIFLHGEIFEFP
jgi:hypothetical protein